MLYSVSIMGRAVVNDFENGEPNRAAVIIPVPL
jgi:hypothetical protein